MTERILFKGSPATAGKCNSCGRILIITDMNSKGDFMSYHEDPMCPVYIARCGDAKPIGLQELKPDDIQDMID